jgi:HAD superfamily hydrolase (TIGR01509 family)
MKFAAVFDMDGVLVDNFDIHTQAWEVFCKRHQLNIATEDLRDFAFGRTNREILTHYFAKPLSDFDIDTMGKEKEVIYREIYAGKVELVKGLPAFLQQLHDNKIPTVIATSASIRNVNFILQQTQSEKYFSMITDASMVSRGKPDPEIYIKAAQRLQLPTEQCVVFEDSFAGIASALAANTNVVGVATTHKAEKLQGCRKVIESFDDISVKELSSWF